MAIPPLAPNPAALEFLSSRRSRPAKTLTGPAPDRAALEPILTAALRVPDHGKLEPWRLIVLERAALVRISGLVQGRGEALGIEPEKIEKSAREYANSPLAIAVVSTPVLSEKVPQIEQTYSAGALCLALLNAALASGWGANWLSGWPSHDPQFCAAAFGLGNGESVAGIVHIGTETAPPPERPRPSLETKVSWVSQ